jgi:hypothetical protein
MGRWEMMRVRRRGLDWRWEQRSVDEAFSGGSRDPKIPIESSAGLGSETREDALYGGT